MCIEKWGRKVPISLPHTQVDEIVLEKFGWKSAQWNGSDIDSDIVSIIAPRIHEIYMDMELKYESEE